jgi:hypothetical protein
LPEIPNAVAILVGTDNLVVFPRAIPTVLTVTIAVKYSTFVFVISQTHFGDGVQTHVVFLFLLFLPPTA